MTLTAQSNNHDYGNIPRFNVFDSPTKTHIAPKMSWYPNICCDVLYTLIIVVEHTKQLPKVF